MDLERPVQHCGCLPECVPRTYPKDPADVYASTRDRVKRHQACPCMLGSCIVLQALLEPRSQVLNVPVSIEKYRSEVSTGRTPEHRKKARLRARGQT